MPKEYVESVTEPTVVPLIAAEMLLPPKVTAATWLARYPSVPRSRVIVPGLYSDQGLCAVGADSALNGTLLSIHIYGMFGDSHTTEQAWINDFEGELCGYSGRAVLTEL